MRWLLLLVGGLCGCDAVFGLDDNALPTCNQGSFDTASPQLVRAEVDAYSLSRDRTLGVFEIRGIANEVIGDREPTPLPLEPMYPMLSIALDPEHAYMLFTAAIEPATIFAARRTGENQWEFEPGVPPGEIAGIPTLALTGDPVRVVVRRAIVRDEFQEYERAGDGTWHAVGDVFHLAARAGANLSSDGLVLVYDGDEAGPGVYVRLRGSRAEGFRDFTRILAGPHHSPQLSDDCRELLVLDDGDGAPALTRYRR